MKKIALLIFVLGIIVASCSKDEPTISNQIGQITSVFLINGNDTIAEAPTIITEGVISGMGKYPKDKPVLITAKAYSGYIISSFELYKGDNLISRVSLNTNKYEYKLTSDGGKYYIKFSFIKEHSLEIDITHGVASGAGRYPHGSTVTVSAKADDEYQFDGWYENGKKISNRNPYSFILNADKRIKANIILRVDTLYVTSTANLSHSVGAESVMNMGLENTYTINFALSRPAKKQITFRFFLQPQAPPTNGFTEEIIFRPGEQEKEISFTNTFLRDREVPSYGHDGWDYTTTYETIVYHGLEIKCTNYTDLQRDRFEIEYGN